MPRPQRPWFRFYVEAVHDRKLRRLTPAQRWLWVAVLAAARQSPTPGQLMISTTQPMDAADLADFAGMTAREVNKAMPLFAASGMVTDHDGTWVVNNWTERQYESDNVTERTRRHRSQEQGRNVPTSFPGTPPESESESESETDPCHRLSSNSRADPQRVDDDDGNEPEAITEALVILARRDLAARENAKGAIGNKPAWLVTAIDRRRAEHAHIIANLPRPITATAEQLVRILEPPKLLAPYHRSFDAAP